MLQNDVLSPTSTVKEVLQFFADLKLLDKSPQEREAVVGEVGCCRDCDGNGRVDDVDMICESAR